MDTPHPLVCSKLLYNFYMKQNTNFQEKKRSFLAVLNRDRKSFPQLQWYSSTTVPTAENLLMDFTLPQCYFKENLMCYTYNIEFRRKFTIASFLLCFQSPDIILNPLIK